MLVSIVQNVLESMGNYLPAFLQFGVELLLNITNGVLNGLPGAMTAGGQVIVSLQELGSSVSSR